MRAEPRAGGTCSRLLSTNCYSMILANFPSLTDFVLRTRVGSTIFSPRGSLLERFDVSICDDAEDADAGG